MRWVMWEEILITVLIISPSLFLLIYYNLGLELFKLNFMRHLEGKNIWNHQEIILVHVKSAWVQFQYLNVHVDKRESNNTNTKCIYKLGRHGSSVGRVCPPCTEAVSWLQQPRVQVRPEVLCCMTSRLSLILFFLSYLKLSYQIRLNPSWMMKLA